MLGLTMLVGLPAGGLALYWLTTVPDVSGLATTNPSSTALMEARMAETREQDRSDQPDWTWVPLSNISPHLQRAVIVAEDASFYQHEGFDWEGIKDAAVRNFEQGKLQRGGSTITQQLAKNLYLSSEKNLLRKINEALITYELEQRLPKKRILEIYLNVVEWGQDVYGAEAAARHHFGKSAKDLTSTEAALLAAILPAPRQNDPLKITPYLTKRQQWILSWMEKKNGGLGLGRAGAPVSP
ncbi:MAG: monofunctional biosynthetic peptidoglycan transglycosylase [Nitrospirae bacterium]|nr:monofunctional biosynthetic peptidoglycan transglycosylase [Nitrospirota bacterium]